MLKAITFSNNFRSAYALLKISPAITRHKVTMTATEFASLVKTAPRIILGSSSSSRRQLMDEIVAEHGFAYDVVTADIDEKAIRVEDPQELVMKLAHAKADAIIEKLKTAAANAGGGGGNNNTNSIEGLLITCDQVVTHEGRILEKPEDAEEAREFISGYGRAPASTIGSTVCTNLATGHRLESLDIATIHFDHIPEETAEILIKEGDVMWCAGGLMVEHPLVVPHVTKMEGGQDAVMGLCKATVVRLLTEALR
jgi:septum formation protein